MESSKTDILLITERLGFCDACIRRVEVSYRLGHWLCRECTALQYHERGIN
jgi:hypothetical protein